MQTIRIAALGALVSSLVVASACSSGTTVTNDGGTTDGSNNNDGTASGNVNQTGMIVDYSSKTGLSMTTVTGGTASATTDSNGNYTLSVPKATPYTMTVAHDAYLTLHEQEWMLSGDANRGQTLAVSNQLESILKGTLSNPIPDPTLGVLSVNVDVMATCGDGGAGSAIGAVINVPGVAQPGSDAGPPGPQTPTIVYFAGGFPSANTMVTDTGTPSAIIYNLAVGSFSGVTVTHPSCTMSPFPVVDPTIPTMTYTGNVTLGASGPKDDAGVTNNVASFMRVFLK